MAIVPKRGSILVSYLFSYIGIALLSCALIGTLIFNMFLSNLAKTELENNKRKIEQAVNDMEEHLKILQSISYDISFNIKYRPLYFQQNKYYEMLLLEDFSKYRGYSPVISEYFLLYHTYDNVFLSSGYSNPVSIYFKRILGINDMEIFCEKLSEVITPSVFPLPNSQKCIIAFPVWATMIAGAKPNATLCFLTSSEILLKRVDNIMGRLENTDIKISICGHQVAHHAMNTQEKDHVLHAVSPDGLVEISLILTKKSVYGSISGFRRTNYIVVVLFVFLLAFIAAIVAYYNFTPIKRVYTSIVKNYRTTEHHNELQFIEYMFNKALESNKRAGEQLTKQMRILRNQSLQLFINGDYSKSTMSLLQQLGINFINDFFTVHIISFLDYDDEFMNDEGAKLISLIDDLSDEDIAFFALPDKMSNVIAVITNLKDESLKEESIDLIKSVLESGEYRFYIGSSSVFNPLYYITTARMEAISDCEKNRIRQVAKEKNIDDTLDPLSYDSKYITKMLREVRIGDFSKACSFLDLFIDTIKKNNHSLILQKYIYSDVLIQIVQLSREINIPISQQLASIVLNAENNNIFREGVVSILKMFCSHSGADFDTNSLKIAKEILSYIDEHFMEYDLSLERLAEEFNMSANYLSRLIKHVAGENYKDYVISLRVSYAKRLLKEGYTVAETCNKVGYINVSHFIKTFKKETGFTPADYKMLG